MKVFSLLAGVCLASIVGQAAHAAPVINVNITSGGGPNTDQPLDGTLFSAGLAPISYTGSSWNDVGGNPNVADLTDSDGLASGIGFSRTSTGGNSGAGFTFSQVDGLVVGGADILDNYLAATNGFGPPLAGPVTFEFTGLDTNATYNFAFVAVGDTAGQGATLTLGGTTLSTTGTSPDGPLVEGDNFVVFSNVTSATGTLTLDLAAGPGNAAFAALSGFQIEAVSAIPEPGSLAAFSLLAGIGLSVRRRRS